mmetsp:Transcript_29479/g.79202  ORF Transcript_29479/g.79202 Transcript_29479/m.79202 type:complete len:217 (+) Transcript_29479:89-739(+)
MMPTAYSHSRHQPGSEARARIVFTPGTSERQGARSKAAAPEPEPAPSWPAPRGESSSATPPLRGETVTCARSACGPTAKRNWAMPPSATRLVKGRPSRRRAGVEAWRRARSTNRLDMPSTPTHTLTNRCSLVTEVRSTLSSESTGELSSRPPGRCLAAPGRGSSPTNATGAPESAVSERRRLDCPGVEWSAKRAQSVRTTAVRGMPSWSVTTSPCA